MIKIRNTYRRNQLKLMENNQIDIQRGIKKKKTSKNTLQPKTKRKNTLDI